MKKLGIILILLSTLFIITACGAKNDTPMDAAETFMKSIVEGDVELNAKVNHSDPFSFPSDYMIEIANDKNLVGKDLSEFDFKEDEDDSKKIIVTWEDENGEEADWKLKFIEEKEGFFFTDLD